MKRTFQARLSYSAYKADSSFPPFKRSRHSPKEIAILGRSNAGKSSLINHLTRAPLAKVSSKPGKTKALHFYDVDDNLRFIDFPGYGFSTCAKTLSQEWASLIDGYFKKSENLSLLLLLQDARRKIEEEERTLIDYASRRTLPLILLLTKADKLKKRERKIKEAEVFQELTQPILFYSIHDDLSRTILIKTIHEVLSHES